MLTVRIPTTPFVEVLVRWATGKKVDQLLAQCKPRKSVLCLHLTRLVVLSDEPLHSNRG